MTDQPRTADLGYARVDLDREARTGDPEVVYGAGKTPEQVVGILRILHEKHADRAVLATRVAPEALALVRAELPDAEVHDVARAVMFFADPANSFVTGQTLYVCGGSSVGSLVI